MTSGGLPPRPKPPTMPQYVGDGDYRFDAAKLTDRGIAIKGLDLILRMQHAMQVHSSEFISFKKSVEDDKVMLLKMATDVEHRLSALEGRPRDPLQSSHEWTELLTEANDLLSRRVKDKKDALSSDRARAIAKEVVESVKQADDAKAFHTWRSRGSKIAFEVIKWFVIWALGVGSYHFGLKGGHIANDAPAIHSGAK